VVDDPAALSWKGAPAVAESDAVRIGADGGFTATAEVISTVGVEYAVRLRVRGGEPTLVVSFGGASASPASAKRYGDTVELFARGVAETPRLQLQLIGRAPTALTLAEVREAMFRSPLQLTSGADRELLALTERPLESGGTRRAEGLLLTGAADYQWPIEGEGEGPTLFTYEAALVPRHLEVGGVIEWAVSSRENGSWRTLLQERREVGDPAVVAGRLTLGAADALRVTARPVGEGSATLALLRPTVIPVHQAARPDVVVISIDALRPDHLGAYGDTRRLTPRLDALGRAGVVFEEARAQRGQTWESLTALGYARFPEELGVEARGQTPQRGIPSVPGRFTAAGYQTLRVGQYQLPFMQVGRFDLEEETRSDGETVRRVRALAAVPRDRPRLWFVHLMATHYPYNTGVPGPPMSRSDLAQVALTRTADAIARVRARYAQAVRAADGEVAEILDEVARSAGAPPIVAICADHGSHQGEAGLWFLHSTVHRAALRVPLLLSAPGLSPGRESRLVRLIDVGPTLLELAGLPSDGFGGRSLLPLVRHQRDAARENRLFVAGGDLVVVEDDEHKLVWNRGGVRQSWAEVPGLTLDLPKVALYAWRRDPEEKENLADRFPEVVQRLSARAAQPTGWEERTVDPAAARLLREAGYAAPNP
jgi:arylsulfatase A-like enzyme